MKKHFLAIALGLIAIATSSSAFAGTEKSEKSGTATIVHSVEQGKPVTTAFSQKGKWIYTITRYTANNADKNIVDMVESAYYKYAITGIDKVEQPGFDAVYIVHLENASSLKNVRISNGEMEVVQDLVRG